MVERADANREANGAPWTESTSQRIHTNRDDRAARAARTFLGWEIAEPGWLDGNGLHCGEPGRSQRIPALELFFDQEILRGELLKGRAEPFEIGTFKTEHLTGSDSKQAECLKYLSFG